jgi:hypothetical protein
LLPFVHWTAVLLLQLLGLLRLFIDAAKSTLEIGRTAFYSD